MMTELRITASELSSKLATVSKVINRKNALPILDNVLLKVDGEKFLLCASSGDAWISAVTKFLLIQGKPKDVCLPVAMLLPAVQTVNGDSELFLDFDDDKHTVKVRYLQGEFTMPFLDANEYPVMQTLKDVTCGFTLPSSFFVPTVKAASKCVAADLLRPQMCCVALDATNEGVTVVASDGHSLYKQSLEPGAPFLQSGTPSVLLLHKDILSTTDHALRGTKNVKIESDGQIIMISEYSEYSEDSENSDNSEITIVTTCVEGKYPNYNSVIPKDIPYKMTVCVKDVTAALKRVGLFANDQSDMLRVSYDGDNLCIEAEDIDYSKRAEEKVGITGECNCPEGFAIGLKNATFSYLLGCVNTENCVLNLISRDRPLLIKDEDVNSSLTLLQMPMVLND